MSRRLQIIGLGSPYGADQSGWQAIDYLMKSNFPSGYPALSIGLYQCASPAHLVGCLEEGAHAIILDALCEEGESGLRKVSHAELVAMDQATSHSLDLSTLIPLLKVLGDGDRQVILLGLFIGSQAATPFSDYGRLERALQVQIRDLYSPGHE